MIIESLSDQTQLDKNKFLKKTSDLESEDAIHKNNPDDFNVANNTSVLDKNTSELPEVTSNPPDNSVSSKLTSTSELAHNEFTSELSHTSEPNAQGSDLAQTCEPSAQTLELAQTSELTYTSESNKNTSQLTHFESSAQVSAPSESSAQASESSESSAQVSAPSELIAQASESSESSAQVSAPSESSAQASESSESSAHASEPSELIAHVSAPSESSAHDSEPSESSAQASESSESSAHDSEPSESSAQASESSESSAHASEPSELIAHVSAPSESSAHDSEPSESSAQASESSESSAHDSEPSESSAQASESSESSAHASEPSELIAHVSAPSESSAQVSEPSEFNAHTSELSLTFEASALSSELSLTFEASALSSELSESSTLTPELSHTSESSAQTSEHSPPSESDKDSSKHSPPSESDKDSSEHSPPSESDKDSSEHSPPSESDNDSSEHSPPSESDKDSSKHSPPSESDKDSSEHSPPSESDKDSSEHSPPSESDKSSVSSERSKTRADDPTESSLSNRDKFLGYLRFFYVMAITWFRSYTVCCFRDVLDAAMVNHSVKGVFCVSHITHSPSDISESVILPILVLFILFVLLIFGLFCFLKKSFIALMQWGCDIDSECYACEDAGTVVLKTKLTVKDGRSERSVDHPKSVGKKSSHTSTASPLLAAKLEEEHHPQTPFEQTGKKGSHTSTASPLLAAKLEKEHHLPTPSEDEVDGRALPVVQHSANGSEIHSEGFLQDSRETGDEGQVPKQCCDVTCQAHASIKESWDSINYKSETEDTGAFTSSRLRNSTGELIHEVVGKPDPQNKSGEIDNCSRRIPIDCKVSGNPGELHEATVTKQPVHSILSRHQRVNELTESVPVSSQCDKLLQRQSKPFYSDRSYAEVVAGALHPQILTRCKRLTPMVPPTSRHVLVHYSTRTGSGIDFAHLGHLPQPPGTTFLPANVHEAKQFEDETSPSGSSQPVEMPGGVAVLNTNHTPSSPLGAPELPAPQVCVNIQQNGSIATDHPPSPGPLSIQSLGSLPDVLPGDPDLDRNPPNIPALPLARSHSEETSSNCTTKLLIRQRSYTCQHVQDLDDNVQAAAQVSVEETDPFNDCCSLVCLGRTHHQVPSTRLNSITVEQAIRIPNADQNAIVGNVVVLPPEQLIQLAPPGADQHPPAHNHPNRPAVTPIPLVTDISHRYDNTVVWSFNTLVEHSQNGSLVNLGVVNLPQPQPEVQHEIQQNGNELLDNIAASTTVIGKS